MTAAAIAEALDVSPAAVSGAVRYLVHVSIVVRTRERGERRDTYLVHDDVWGEFFAFMHAELPGLIGRWRASSGRSRSADMGPESNRAP